MRNVERPRNDARRVVLSWSGGKDSSLALAALRADPAYEVVALLTSITQEYDRVSIHGVRRALVEAQASALGLPLIEVVLRPNSSNDAYEAAFLDALARVRHEHPDVTHLAFGDLFLADVRAYRERLVETTGYQTLFPLWGRDTTALAREFIDAEFRAILVCIDTQQLPASFASRDFDMGLLASLPATVDPCGENGEFHTFVWDGPIFETPIGVQRGEIALRDERFAFADVTLDLLRADN
ncbi:MAG: ATP-binding protein [bacterium]